MAFLPLGLLALSRDFSVLSRDFLVCPLAPLLPPPSPSGPTYQPPSLGGMSGRLHPEAGTFRNPLTSQSVDSDLTAWLAGGQGHSCVCFASRNVSRACLKTSLQAQRREARCVLFGLPAQECWHEATQVMCACAGKQVAAFLDFVGLDNESSI